MIPNLPPSERWISRPKGRYAHTLFAELERISDDLDLDLSKAAQFCSREKSSWGILILDSDGVLVQIQCGEGEKDRTLVSVATLKPGSWPSYLLHRRICHRSNLDRVAGERLQAQLPEMLAHARDTRGCPRVRVTTQLLASCCWRLMEMEVLAPSKAHRALKDLQEQVGMDMTKREISEVVAAAAVRESAERSLFAWPEMSAKVSDLVSSEVSAVLVRAARHVVE